MIGRSIRLRLAGKALRAGLNELKAREVQFHLEHRKRQKSERSRQELVEEIRFGDLLRADLQILILDFPRDEALWLLALTAVAVGTTVVILTVPWPDMQPESVLFLRVLSGAATLLAARFYSLHFARTVFRMSYCTRTQEFTLWRLRSFLPFLRSEMVPKDDLLYTRDAELNRRRVNLINIRSLEGYFVDPGKPWLRADLFAHLLKQHVPIDSVKEFNKAY